LNPFSGLSDLRNLTVGNPDLDPMFINSFELTVLTKAGKFSINRSVYYQYTTNFFEYIVERTMENYFMNTPRESGHGKSLRSRSFYNLQPKKNGYDYH
jgi:outer membrane receptor protein involved in Fe transport